MLLFEHSCVTVGCFRVAVTEPTLRLFASSCDFLRFRNSAELCLWTSATETMEKIISVSILNELLVLN